MRAAWGSSDCDAVLSRSNNSDLFAEKMEFVRNKAGEILSTRIGSKALPIQRLSGEQKGARAVLRSLEALSAD